MKNLPRAAPNSSKRSDLILIKLGRLRNLSAALFSCPRFYGAAPLPYISFFPAQNKYMEKTSLAPFERGKNPEDTEIRRKPPLLKEDR